MLKADAIPLTETQKLQVEQFYYLAVGIARKMYQHTWIRGRIGDLDDVLYFAFLGLIKAAKGFKPALGFTFMTYATHAIQRTIVREVAASSLIHVPHYIRHALGRMEAGKEPCQPVRADYLECGRKTIHHLDEKIDLADRRTDCQSVLPAQERQALLNALAELPERWQQVLRLRFGLDGEPLKLAEIGQRLGVCKERIRQIEKQALEALRQKLTGQVAA